MRGLRIIPMVILPLALGALLTSADAQGKGQGKGADKSNPGQGHGAGKSAKAPNPAPASSKAQAARQSGPPQNRGQAKSAENHGRALGADNRGQARAADNRAEKAASEKQPMGAIRSSDNRPAVSFAPNRGRAVSQFARELRVSEVRPSARRFVVSNRPAEFITGGALAYALARGAPENVLLVTPTPREVAVRNRKGDLLLSLDDERARTLGIWEVRPVTDRVNSGAPAFCRSGQGHPVWGRQWCLEKGFGLGTSQDTRWGASGDVGDIVFGRRVPTPILTRDALLALLGNVAFDRLALHALTLGFTDPLTGVWRGEASGPQVLLVNAGSHPIAEFVDGNRDQRPDLMLVALRPW
ncbi:MAG: hypothetical protein ACJ8AE_07730 [Gemmatimonadaceae bacterium]